MTRRLLVLFGFIVVAYGIPGCIEVAVNEPLDANSSAVRKAQESEGPRIVEEANVVVSAGRSTAVGGGNTPLGQSETAQPRTPDPTRASTPRPDSDVGAIEPFLLRSIARSVRRIISQQIRQWMFT